jgi:hypothetical protein
MSAGAIFEYILIARGGGVVAILRNSRCRIGITSPIEGSICFQTL